MLVELNISCWTAAKVDKRVTRNAAADNNAIDSSRIAEAQIEFVGQGVLNDAEAPGWLARVGGFLWPF